jgi:hypothetical protein
MSYQKTTIVELRLGKQFGTLRVNLSCGHRATIRDIGQRVSDRVVCPTCSLVKSESGGKAVQS